MNLALVLIHNRNNVGNAAQITAFLPFISMTIVAEDGLPYASEDLVPDNVPYFKTYAIVGTVHTAKFYQIVPFGVARPTNMGLIDSHNVLYGLGDEGKTGTHPRFANWAMKRGFDYGAQAVVYLTDPATLTAASLELELAALTGSMVLRQPTWGYVISPRLLSEIGQMLEDRNFNSSLTNLRQRITAAGLQYG